jgi:hypothetical protein
MLSIRAVGPPAFRLGDKHHRQGAAAHQKGEEAEHGYETEHASQA